MNKTLVLIGITPGSPIMPTNGHLSTLKVHHKLVKRSHNKNIIHFSFTYDESLDIYGNIDSQCKQLSCNFNNNNIYIIGITCNTMHLYYDYYFKCMNYPNVKLLNVISLTADYLSKKGYRRVGLLSTNETRDSGLYKYPLNFLGIELLTDKTNIEDSIDRAVIGKNNKSDMDRLKNIIKSFSKQGCTCIILGCSEIPIIITEKVLFGMKMIDPMNILAKKMVKS